MYQHLLHYLCLILFHNYTNLINFHSSSWRFWSWKISTHLYYVNFINATVKRTIVAFLFNVKFITFSLYYFFNPKFFFICFLQFFFIKASNNFFVLKIINNIWSWPGVFNFFTHKNLFRSIWNRAFCKVFLYFDILTI